MIGCKKKTNTTAAIAVNCYRAVGYGTAGAAMAMLIFSSLLFNFAHALIATCQLWVW